jgi:hypothetical protein
MLCWMPDVLSGKILAYRPDGIALHIFPVPILLSCMRRYPSSLVPVGQGKVALFEYFGPNLVSRSSSRLLRVSLCAAPVREQDKPFERVRRWLPALLVRVPG